MSLIDGMYWENLDREEEENRPLTNYERLVSKTPEEMAGWLVENIYCIDCPQEENCMLQGRSMDCRSVWLDWLKSPAEE